MVRTATITIHSGFSNLNSNWFQLLFTHYKLFAVFSFAMRKLLCLSLPKDIIHIQTHKLFIFFFPLFWRIVIIPFISYLSTCIQLSLSYGWMELWREQLIGWAKVLWRHTEHKQCNGQQQRTHKSFFIRYETASYNPAPTFLLWFISKSFSLRAIFL